MEKKKILPAIKKDIKHFLLSEEAKMSKKSIANIGMSLTMLGVMLDAGVAQAAHTSSFFNEPSRGAHSSHGAHGSHASHSSHASHGSHSAHGSHGSHGSHSAHGSHASHGSHSSHASHGAHGSHGSHGQW